MKEKVASGMLVGLIHARKDGTYKHYPRVELQMNDKDIVERIAKFMGGKVYKNSYKQLPHHKDVYRTYVLNEKAMDVMDLIYPFMSERRKQKIDEISNRHRSGCS